MRLDRLRTSDRVEPHEHALSAHIDGEVVALNIAKGVCYGLDEIGSRIWELVQTPTTVEALCQTLTALYAVEPGRCRREVIDLLEDLRGEDLVIVHPRECAAFAEG